jgi:hypothetical protein
MCAWSLRIHEIPSYSDCIQGAVTFLKSHLGLRRAPESHRGNSQIKRYSEIVTFCKFYAVLYDFIRSYSIACGIDR